MDDSASPTEALLDALCQRQRLDLLGQLTGSLAHDLGSPLSAVSGYAELLLARDLPAEFRPDVEAVLASARQASRTAAQLLAFARRLRSGWQEELDLNPLVAETVELGRRLFAQEQVLLLEELDASLPRVRGCPGQLQQLLFELLLNRRDRLRRGPGQGAIQVRTCRRDQGAAVEVEDDGPESSPGETESLFDPSARAGLGLSLARRLARRHGGELRLTRTAEGVCLLLELPGAEPQIPLEDRPVPM